jgi:hypothetical protein
MSHRLGKDLLIIALGCLIAIFLALVSSDFKSLTGWGSFIALCLLGAGILWVGWQSLQDESVPSWVGNLLIGAAVLRLAVGVFWYVALPQWGYGSPVEKGGYIMADAQSRDLAAWELSQSDASLWTAFRDYRGVDQYGGLLFLSAFVYRYLGGDLHQPLMMVVLTSAFSALLVPFAWAFTSYAWGEKAAGISAWSLALYPEAVLLGSSQMREAFTITLAAMAFYGLLRYWRVRGWGSLAWILGAWLLSLPLSPLFGFLLLLTLGLVTLTLNEWRLFKNWRVWVVLGLIILLVIVGGWFLGSRVLSGNVPDPVTLLSEWLKYTSRWQAYLSEHSSGWIQKLFRSTPTWMNTYILLGYGVARPFLPAAILASGNWLWRGVAVWRAIGWTLLLPFLFYALIRSLGCLRKRFLAAGMSLATWGVILVASFRGGGDQWDNPRYRASFAVLQVALAAWVIVEHQRESDPWLRRIVIGIGWIIVWFLPWYVGRYTSLDWPVQDVFKTLGLGLASAVLFALWDWAKLRDEGLLG